MLSVLLRIFRSSFLMLCSLLPVLCSLFSVLCSTPVAAASAIASGATESPPYPRCEPNGDEQAQAPVLTHGRTDQRRIALTFDADAFNAGTDQILDTLRIHKAQATFFLTGTWMRNNPRLVQRIIAEKHQLAIHGNTHVDFRTLSDREIRQQLRRAERELMRYGIRGWPYIRLPSDAYDGRVLRVLCNEGYNYIFWALDVRDAVGEPKDAAYVEDRAVNGLSPDKRQGAIMLLHLGKPGTTEALPRILQRLAGEGFEFVTVGEV